jgi:hypothetical protein
MTANKPHPDDPFAGYPPTPVRCRWLNQHDQDLAPSAEVVRLIVDDQRGHGSPWANDLYQRHFLREIVEFIGPTRAVLMTYAGTLTAYMPSLEPTMQSLHLGLAQLRHALNHVEFWPPQRDGDGAKAKDGVNEMLVGVDGAECAVATHLQTVVHLRGEPQFSLRNTAIKIYPTSGERPTLAGWQVCTALKRIPEDLASGRRMHTAAGTVLVLVCNDAAIFGARSKSNLGSKLGLAIRQHFLDQARKDPRPKYILIATHWQGKRRKTSRWSGEPFRQAAQYLADETGATVVTTMRSPRPQLAEAAGRFSVVGPRADKVASLLVEDTEQTAIG